MDVTVRDLTAGDDAEARALMERVGVEGYFKPGELARYVDKSTTRGVCCALGAFDGQARMLGFRLTLPPGSWSHGRGREDGRRAGQMEPRGAALGRQRAYQRASRCYRRSK